MDFKKIMGEFIVKFLTNILYQICSKTAYRSIFDLQIISVIILHLCNY